MDELRWEGFVGVTDPDLATGLRALHVVQLGGEDFVITLTGLAGGLVSYRLSESGAPVEVDSAYAPDDNSGGLSGALTPLILGGQLYMVTGADATGRLQAYSFSNTGQLGSREVLEGPQALASGPIHITQGTNNLLWMAGTDETGGYIRSFLPDGQGAYAPSALTRDSDAAYLADPVALQTVSLGVAEYVITLSGTEAGVSVFAADAGSGALSLVSSMGLREGLGILSAPQALEVITAHGTTYLLVASAAQTGEAGALSVLELGADGSLTATDHILDSLETRFGAIQDLSVVLSGDWTYVVAAGGDGGISLFTLMPDGTLVHLDTIIHQVGQGLSGLQAIVATLQGDGIEILVGSDDVPGIGRLSFSLSDQGQVIQGDTSSQTITGTGLDDLIAGGAGDEVLQGMAGDDILTDGAGRDTLEGGAGNDIFVPVMDGEVDQINGFVIGEDLLDLSRWQMLYDPSQLQIDSTPWGAKVTWRGEVLDIYSATGLPLTRDLVEASVIRATDHPPLILGGNSQPPQVITGGPANDTLAGGAGDDTLFGEGGDNLLFGNGGADELRGLEGNDIAEGGIGRDRAYLGAGDDLYIDDPEDGPDGGDLIYVGDGDDTILGAGGNDELHGMNGADLLEGGAGDDTIYAGTGFDLVWGGDGDDELWAGEGFDTVYGEDRNDVIYGLPGFDLIDGGAGADTLWGGDGDDTIIGGTGRDLGYLGNGSDTFLDDAEGRLEGSDEMFMGNGNDSAFGQGSDDILHGMDGDDLLEGGAGNDTLFGGANADVLRGGEGDDEVWGGLGTDYVEMGAGNDLFEDTDQGGDLGRDTVFSGLGNDTVNGDAGDDEFHGQDGDDLLRGGLGNDTLYGGANADSLVGGEGNDEVWGGLGTDYVELGAGNDLFIDTDQGGDLGRDTVFAGEGDDTILGDAGDDRYNGQEGADLLNGGSGADILDGGAGNDTLTGGIGADEFIFAELSGDDLISDFAPGEDQLVFDQAGVATTDDLTLSQRPEGLHLSWTGGSVLLEGILSTEFDFGDVLIL